MNVKPIPNELLGDSITLILPTAAGKTEKKISNVRVELSDFVGDYSSKSPNDGGEITVWADKENSTAAEFPVGARVRYRSMTFEIIESKTFYAAVNKPHHIKFKARKTGDDIQ